MSMWYSFARYACALLHASLCTIEAMLRPNSAATMLYDIGEQNENRAGEVTVPMVITIHASHTSGHWLLAGMIVPATKPNAPARLCRPTLFRNRVMELNASDERGISVVRDKIKTFASTSIGKPDAGYPCPPYKILILDEADSMTQA
jgi:DNA polymerase III delta prime subunit